MNYDDEMCNESEDYGILARAELSRSFVEVPNQT